MIELKWKSVDGLIKCGRDSHGESPDAAAKERLRLQSSYITEKLPWKFLEQTDANEALNRELQQNFIEIISKN